MAEHFHQQFHKQQAFDSSSFIPYSYTDTFAPGVDQFELDLDSTLAGFQGSPAIVADPTPVFNTLRSEPYNCGPASAFTADSDSTYDSYSVHSASVYSPVYNTNSAYSLPADFNFDFSKIQMDNLSEYSSSQEIDAFSAALGMGDAYATPSPDRSPSFSSSPFSSRSSHSDYEPPTMTRTPLLSSASDYMPGNKIGGRPSPRHQMTITPSSTMSRVLTSPSLPTVPLIPPLRTADPAQEDNDDPKKKYKCPNCSRAFARAFNLKTHRETHNPNRAKPHACPFPSCGRSFSRKHDLGRHMNSIHRVDPNSDIKAVGVERGDRSRCDGCGKSWVGGKYGSCECDFDFI